MNFIYNSFGIQWIDRIFFRSKYSKTACEFSAIVYLVKKAAPPIVRCYLTIGGAALSQLFIELLQPVSEIRAISYQFRTPL